MIKLTCLLSLLDFILGIRETKFRDVVKSIRFTMNLNNKCGIGILRL